MASSRPPCVQHSEDVQICEMGRFVPRWVVLVGLLAGTLAVGACENGNSSQGYEQKIMQARVERDMSMRKKESVLPPSRRSAFRGLDYYDVDPAYRFVVPFQRFAHPDTVMVAESTGGVRPQVQLGRITVPFPSGKEDFLVFQSTGENPRSRLWLAFADATNGEETYEAGRYVNLEPAGEDSVVVDFNRSYNPTCAYNPDYACPLPPSENRIDAPIRAGEKTPLFKGDSPSK